MDKIVPSAQDLQNRRKEIQNLFDRYENLQEDSEGILLDDLDTYFQNENDEDYSDIVSHDEAVEDNSDKSKSEDIDDLFKQFEPVYKKKVDELKNKGVFDQLTFFHNQNEIKETVTEIVETTPLCQRRIRHSNRLINQSTVVASPLSQTNPIQHSITVPYTNDPLHNQLQTLPQGIQDFVDNNRDKIAKLRIRELTFEFTPVNSQPVTPARFLVANINEELPALMEQIIQPTVTRTTRSNRSCSTVSNITAPSTQSDKFPVNSGTLMNLDEINNTLRNRKEINTQTHKFPSNTSHDDIEIMTTKETPQNKETTIKVKANARIPKRNCENLSPEPEEVIRSSSNKTTAPANQANEISLISKKVIILTDPDRIKDLAPGTWFKVETNSEPVHKCSFDDSSSDDSSSDEDDVI